MNCRLDRCIFATFNNANTLIKGRLSYNYGAKSIDQTSVLHDFVFQPKRKWMEEARHYR